MKKFCLIFFLASYYLLPTIVLAEIKVPYVVDEITAEKPRILFGDSTEITATSTSGEVITYYGLENYTTNYVNNYLHITFTYTHAALDTFCCYASYPPAVYITALDPRATSTPTERSSLTIYTLAPKPIPPGHSTNLYLYDIQLDATGYTA